MGKIVCGETEDRHVAFVQFQNNGVRVDIILIGNDQNGGRHGLPPKLSPEGKSRTLLAPAPAFLSYPFNHSTKASERSVAPQDDESDWPELVERVRSRYRRSGDQQ